MPFPAQNKAYLPQLSADTSALPLFNSLTHLTYLTSTSSRWMRRRVRRLLLSVDPGPGDSSSSSASASGSGTMRRAGTVRATRQNSHTSIVPDASTSANAGKQVMFFGTQHRLPHGLINIAHHAPAHCVSLRQPPRSRTRAPRHRCSHNHPPASNYASSPAPRTAREPRGAEDWHHAHAHPTGAVLRRGRAPLAATARVPEQVPAARGARPAGPTLDFAAAPAEIPVDHGLIELHNSAESGRGSEMPREERKRETSFALQGRKLRQWSTRKIIKVYSFVRLFDRLTRVSSTFLVVPRFPSPPPPSPPANMTTPAPAAPAPSRESPTSCVHSLPGPIPRHSRLPSPASSLALVPAIPIVLSSPSRLPSPLPQSPPSYLVPRPRTQHRTRAGIRRLCTVCAGSQPHLASELGARQTRTCRLFPMRKCCCRSSGA
ncbi:hypothetical protein B0H16DRAFT_1838361 [Mycena metata]|uniref:Uncharacterized protein n=1 Tax=Mycena metata TaxID=1033252 RepID=A0AAD7NXD1_9AGAR|nr:hypothetical protein B0H16DRAFT_1838361 [Mycena metata]